MASEITLEPIKEGVDSVEVNAIKVGVGDVVSKNQTLLEVQADKAALEVGSPVAGKVTKILVKSGDQIKVGQPYLVIEVTNGKAQEKPAKPRKEEAAAKAEEKAIAKQDDSAKTSPS